MDNHPKGKEQFTEKRSPWLVPTVDGVGYSGDHPHQVYYEEGGGRDEEGGPFEHVELGKVTILIRGLGGDSEVGVDSSEYFEETLDDGKEMGGDTTDNPKLLVPPPLVYSDTAPPHLKDAGGKDGKEEGYEPDTCKVTNLPAQRSFKHFITTMRD